jgi:hypothetical protein
MSNNNASLNEALRKAVHAIANKKLQALASGIKSAANANGPAKTARIAQLEKLLAEAQAAARAAGAAGPAPVTPTTVNAENAAVQALIQNIAKGNYNKPNKTNVNVNRVQGNARYRNVNEIQTAIAKRRSNLTTPPPLPNKPAIERYISNLMGNKLPPLASWNWPNIQAVYNGLPNWEQITPNQRKRLGEGYRAYQLKHAV